MILQQKSECLSLFRFFFQITVEFQIWQRLVKNIRMSLGKPWETSLQLALTGIGPVTGDLLLLHDLLLVSLTLLQSI